MKAPDLPAPAASTPFVSVIIANYNDAAQLTDAIASVQHQSLKNLEIIVSDDGSTDDSFRIVTGLMRADPRIRLIRSERNYGPAAARNRALVVAKGDWIAIMDSDDLMHPARLEFLVQAAIRDGADIVADDLLEFNSDRCCRPRALLKGRWAISPFWVEIADYIRLNRLYGPGPALGYLKPLFRASIFTAPEAVYDETLTIGEDYNLVLRLLHSGKRFRVYPLLLYFYRKHKRSISYRLNVNALNALKVADLRFLNQLSGADRRLAAVVLARTRSINTACAFENLLSSLRDKNWMRAFGIALRRPQALALLRLAFAVKLRRLMFNAAAPKLGSLRAQVCILSRQRVIGRTNGSSTYLLDLVAAIAKLGVDVHFLAPSPTTLGSWPYLRLSGDMSIFKTIRVRGTWRCGRYLVSLDLRRIFRGGIAFLDKLLLNLGMTKKLYFRRAPYSVAESLTRADQLFIAQHGRAIGDFLIADYCFLTDAFPYALRPDAKTAVIMHDRFSSRPDQFNNLRVSDSVVSISEEEECGKLSQADIIVPIQWEEAEFVRKKVSSRRVIVAPMAASPVSAAQPGKSNLVLFIGSSTAPNVDGIRWFLNECWPRIWSSLPYLTLNVAGTICQTLGPAPRGAMFLGFVEDTTSLYAEAGVVISPLRAGSGLKIKLIEALAHGKAVVATPKTLQGVEALFSQAVCLAEDPNKFASAVTELLIDRNARAALAARGLAAVHAHFSYEACYGELLSHIGSFVQAKNQARSSGITS
jgi:glycosyltransferase involved in cell wall biosynthesis